jgi:deoxyinosine 3'endonuclease (endonuclease V)
VSQGYKISLETAVQIVMRTSIHRVPEPIRLADKISRAEIRRQEEQAQS